jgi:hypothetical protein
MHSEHILPLNSPKNFGTLKGIFFCKIYYNIVSVEAGEKQGYTKEFSWPSRPLIHLILRHSVRAFGTQLSPYFIN